MVGSSYDNALAKTINGLSKTELIVPRRSIEDVELHRALRTPLPVLRDVPPVELEAAYYAQRQRPAAG